MQIKPINAKNSTICDGLRIVLAGSVGSTRQTLAGLIRNQANVVGALELGRDKSKQVSGYQCLSDIAVTAEIPCESFRNINDAETVNTIRTWNPDLLFVVGLSQLVKSELLSMPRLGCVGFHPTLLPNGRGRAPLAWLTFDSAIGAATFFLMETRADSGPILAQEPFRVSANDYATDVIYSINRAIDVALDRWLPRLLTGEWDPQIQDDSKATYYGRRAPEDGLIDWQRPAKEIYALIRATSHPHPGAYTYVKDTKIVVWSAHLETELPYHGVVGRVLKIEDDQDCLVQTGDGLLWLTDMDCVNPSDDLDVNRPLRVGMKLGYVVEDEFCRLNQRITELEQRVAQLDPAMPGV